VLVVLKVANLETVTVSIRNDIVHLHRGFFPPSLGFFGVVIRRQTSCISQLNHNHHLLSVNVLSLRATSHRSLLRFTVIPSPRWPPLLAFP
jgi:hypothetical protein